MINTGRRPVPEGVYAARMSGFPTLPDVWLKRLTEAFETAGAPHSSESLLDAALGQALDLLPGASGEVWFAGPDDGLPDLQVSSGAWRRAREERRGAVHRTLQRHAPRSVHPEPGLFDEGLLLFPFRGTGEVHAALVVEVPGAHAVTREQRLALQTLTDHLAAHLSRRSHGNESSRLRHLAQAAVRINEIQGLQATLDVITEEARALIGAHQAVTSLTVSADWAQAVTAVSMSDKYAPWQSYAVPPDGSGIYALVCQGNTPLRLSQAELEAHPRWRAFGPHAQAHPPMRGWLAVPLVGRDGQNIGLIQLSDRFTGDFTAEDQDVLVQLALVAAARVENARLYDVAQEELRRREQVERDLRALNDGLERRVNDRTQQLEVAARQLQDQVNALDGFVAFHEAVGTQTDVLALVQQAAGVIRASLAHVSVAYYERESGLWKARVWSEDILPHVVAQIQAGVPEDAPDFARAVQSEAPVFIDGWEADANSLSSTASYGAVALTPVSTPGGLRGMLAVGTQDARVWTDREQAIVRSVGRSLELALERAEVTSRLQAQNAVLEGFAHLTRDLATQRDPLVIVRRAQEVMLSLLPAGYALYYTPDAGRWRNRVQVGDVGHRDLQAFIDAGPLIGLTPTVDVPWQSRAPYYQDQYARGSDTPPELVTHVSTAASLPVVVRDEVVGVLVMVLFQGRPWTSTDRVVLETVVGSLGLALERAESVALLAQRTEQLESSNAELARSNAELEQFAYVASHDLQAPIRAVTSFASMISRRNGEQLDERGQLYLRHIIDSGEHMKNLVDDLLAFSRLHTQQLAVQPVDSRRVFDTVLHRLSAVPGNEQAQITRTDLPLVLADRQQLDQLLQNLIGNSLKYRRADVLPRVHVSAEADGRMWRFAVNDNGIGIDPRYFDKIFVIFQRLHGRDVYEGTGIGLAVCKKIVERHGGRLWVESTPGEGSTFYFTLPQAPA